MLLRVASFFLICAGIFLFIAAGFSRAHSAAFNYPWAEHYLNTFGWDAWLPRHLPGLWSQMGGYDFFFYGPIPFWFMASVVSPLCVGCSVENTIVLAAVLFWVLSSLTYFLFLRRYLETPFALFGALVYAILPYHLLIDWFVRQSIGEFAAYAFIPLVAYGVDAIRFKERGAWVLSLGVCGTVLCHLPTALLAAHVFGLVVLVLTWQKYRLQQDPRHFFGKVVFCGALGGLLSCFYWLPALALLDTVSDGFLYTDHFVAENWLVGFPLGAPSRFFYAFLSVIPFIVAAAFLPDTNIRTWVVVPVAIVVFLNTDLSGFIWRNWVIAKVQFPWRMMVFVDFSAAMALAFMLKKLGSFYSVKVAVICCVLGALPAAMVSKDTVRWVLTGYHDNPAQPGAGEYLSLETMAVARSRLGLSQEDPLAREQIAVEIQEISDRMAERTAALMSVDIGHRRVEIIPLQEATQLSVPVLYWSLWRAKLEGDTPLDLSPNREFGTIDVMAPADGFQGRSVMLVLPYHWSEKVGGAVSAASLGVLLLLMFWSGAHTSKSTAARAPEPR